MAKLTLSDLVNLENEVSAVATINNNSAATETALENTLSRDGTSPNAMEADLDMNSNRILNLPAPAAMTEPVRLQDVLGPVDINIIDNSFTVSAFMQTVLDDASADVARSTLQAASRYWINVKDFGALGDGASDDTVAIGAAYAALIARSPGGGTLFFPVGVYLFSTFPTIAQAGITILGDGRSGAGIGTVLRPTNTTGDDIILNEQYCYVKNLSIIPTVRKTAGYAIVFKDTSYHSGVDGITVQNGYSGIRIEGGSELHLQNINLRSLLGDFGFQLLSTTGLFGTTINEVTCDNPYPQAYGTVKTWSTATAFALNDIIFNNSRIYQCSTAGTSSGAGSGPSGLPAGATAVTAFTNTITDGTAQWKYVCSTLQWMLIDQHCFSIRLNNVALINGWAGFVLEDGAGLGILSRPTWIFVNNLEVDHAFTNGVLLNRGCDFYCANGWFGSTLNGNGVNIASTFTGSAAISHSRIAGNFNHGILVQAGPKGVLLSNNYVQHNSQAGAASFHGITITSDTTDFVIQGNQVGPDPNIGGGNPQGFGILVSAGTSDRYIINANLVNGNVTAGVSDGGTGINKSVTANF